MTTCVVNFEFKDKCVLDLETSLNNGPLFVHEGRENHLLNEELIGEMGGLKMFIRANEHPPPHFHVAYNGENNSFSIVDGEPLYPNNGLKKYNRNIRKWYSKNREKLRLAWNRNRPSNCPVGPI